MFQVKDVFRNAQTIILIFIILFGAWHLLRDRLFPPEETRDPRAELTHEIHSACLDSENRWVRAIVEVRNTGHDPVHLSEHVHYVAQIVPVGEKLRVALHSAGPAGNGLRVINLPQLLEPHAIGNQAGDFAITPSAKVILGQNESHRQYLDFLIRPSAEVIEVTSAFKDSSLNEDGARVVSWEGTARTIYEIKADPACSGLSG